MRNNIQEFDERLFTTKEVAEMLCVTPRTIYNYRSDTRLEGYKISKKKILYKGSAIRKLLYETSTYNQTRKSLREIVEMYGVRL